MYETRVSHSYPELLLKDYFSGQINSPPVLVVVPRRWQIPVDTPVSEESSVVSNWLIFMVLLPEGGDCHSKGQSDRLGRGPGDLPD